jgi:myb proto-oncogene protein
VLVPGRSNSQCRQRWCDSLDPGIYRSKWTEEEMAKLTNAVKKHGGNDWIRVALLVPGRTHKQCHSRWVTNLKHIDEWAHITRVDGHRKKTQS